MSELDKAASDMISISKTTDVYHSWAVFAEPFKGRKSENALALPGFFLDVDLRSEAEGVHSANEQLPGTFEEVLELIVNELGWPHPTGIRISGNGAYFDYLTESPILLEDATKHQTVQAASQQFQRSFIAAGKKKGWTFDSVGDSPALRECREL